MLIAAHVLLDRKFLHSVCDVPEPEERFSMDEFSEQLIVNRPIVYISVSELLNTHKVSRSRTKTLWVQKVRVVPGTRH